MPTAEKLVERVRSAPAADNILCSEEELERCLYVSEEVEIDGKRVRRGRRGRYASTASMTALSSV
jgi:hypothetical protein